MGLRWKLINALAGLLAPMVIVGCGGRMSVSGTESATQVWIHAEKARIDTNGTTRFTATSANGEPARVEWSVSGGDAHAGAGTIGADGLYTPPSYLTEESVTVAVKATLPGLPRAGWDRTTLEVTPGFLQPLTPGNLSVGAGATATITGSMTEVGGSGGIEFALASDTAGAPSTAGTLTDAHCVRGSVKSANPAYTVCSVTYTAPAVVPVTGSVFVLGKVSSSSSSNATVSWTRVLLNAAGVTSSPVAHQARLAVPVQLGSSSGNNGDYDASLGQVTECCGGTLGALLQDANGTQFVLSNNHVLARSDQSIAGDTIIQPGLIDNGCTPYGYGPGTTPVATLTGYPALSAAGTNVDAAIARVVPGAVDARGAILELGAKQPDGTLAAAAPGVSSTGGRGEAVALGMMVAKSGRTTGLTCAAVSAVDLDISVDYFSDCAETTHSFSKTFTNQIAITGTSFTDAGDSGALVVDASNAEPVGLFFAGGTDVNGVEHAIANPVGEVLGTLEAQVPGATGLTSYSFVGGADHAVSCLNYGGGTGSGSGLGKTSEDLVAELNAAERERTEEALPLAQVLLGSGIVRATVVGSRDHPGEGAVGLSVEAASQAVPNLVAGVPTAVLSAGDAGATQPKAASMAAVLAVKQQNSAALMKANAAIFGVGVGQSLDNPADAAVILYVDRKKAPGKLPETLEGQRVRVILMDRLHVTKAHGAHGAFRSGVGACGLAHGSTSDPLGLAH